MVFPIGGHAKKSESIVFDSNGNVIGLNTRQGIFPLLPDATKPIVMIGGDHAYAMWYGTNGNDGMAAWYAKYGVRPYCAINTDTSTGTAPGSSGCMTWLQTAAIQSKGAELLSHGTTHPNNWEQISSGIAVWYTGADAGTPTGQVTYSNVTQHPVPANLVLTSSASTDNVTLSLVTYTTLATLAAAIIATGKWNCEIDPSLPTNTPTANLIGQVSAVNLTKSSSTAGGFAVGGALILLTYTGTAYKRVICYRSYNSNLFIIMADGVQIGSWSLTSGSFNTLTLLVAAINALAITGLTATLCNNGGVSAVGSRSYVSLTGKEATTAIGFQENVGLGQRTISLDCCYMSRAQVIINQQTVSQTTAQSNGVTLQGFAQSGSSYYPWTIPGNSAFQNHRHNGFLNSYSPVASISRVTSQPNALTHQNIQGAYLRFYYTGAGTTATIQLTSGSLLVGTVTGSGSGTDSFSFDVTNGSYNTIKKIRDAVQAINSGVWTVTSLGLSISASPNHDPSSVLTTGLAALDAKNVIGYTGAQIPASAVSLSREIAALDALADCPGFYYYRLAHKVIYDGSSGFSGMSAVDPYPAYGDISESALDGTLSHMQALIQAGSIINLTPNQFAKIRQISPKPTNFVFNPNFRYSSGENLLVNETSASAVPNGAGHRIPGWDINGSSVGISAISIANNALTITTTSATGINPFNQQIQLEPKKEYEFGADVTLTNFTSGGYVRLQLLSQQKNPPYTSPRDSTVGFYTQPIYDSQTVVRRFYIDNDDLYPLAQMIGNVTEPFNLSTNNQIGLNVDGVATIANINCALGAVNSSAVTAAEVANAINIAIQNSGSYGAEFWKCASAVAGKVMITCPYRRSAETTFSIITSAGSADAQTAIFGSTNNKSYSPNIKSASASDFLYLFTMSINIIGVVTIANPYIKEIRENV